MLHKTRSTSTFSLSASRTKFILCFLTTVLLCAFAAAGAHGAELGNIRVHSWLGRQLKASVPLIGEDARESEVRCFKASLVNLNQEVVSNLKITLQHSAKSSVLLLAGGNAVDEPAAMVRVENVCGTGERRDYAVLLDLVPESASQSQAVPSEPAATAPAEPQKSETDVRKPLPDKQREVSTVASVRAVQAGEAGQNMSRMTPIVPHTIVIAGLKLAAMLVDPAADKGRGAAPVSSYREMQPSDTFPKPVLRLDRSLARAAGDAMPGSAGKGESTGLTATIAAILAFLGIFGAAAWIILRVREMKTAAKPWIPVDVVLDSAADESRTDAPSRP